uniref:efflux RND transporter permease subunit n=1 Tax=Halomonas sp. TaxID=1486246 RepID=UPI0025B881D3
MTRRGPIAWMVHHGVAPNLLMLLLIIGGLMASTTIKKEVFPDFELEIITVAIGYPGATPEEVERSLLLPLEAALAGVDGIDELTATANEGAGRVSASLVEGVEVMRVYQEIQQAVGAITSLPAAADPPRFGLAGRSRSVMSLQLHGWVDDQLLHDLAEEMRAGLQAASGISRVELSGNREREIQVLLDEEAMQ